MRQALIPAMADNDEPWDQKMYRVLWRALLITRAIKRSPQLSNINELERLLEVELALLEAYGGRRDG